MANNFGLLPLIEFHREIAELLLVEGAIFVIDIVLNLCQDILKPEIGRMALLKRYPAKLELGQNWLLGERIYGKMLSWPQLRGLDLALWVVDVDIERILSILISK